MLEWLVQAATERMNTSASKRLGDAGGVWALAALVMTLLWLFADVFIADPLGRWLAARSFSRSNSRRRAIWLVRILGLFVFAAPLLVLAARIVVALQAEKDLFIRLFAQLFVLFWVGGFGRMVYKVGFRRSRASSGN